GRGAATAAGRSPGRAGGGVRLHRAGRLWPAHAAHAGHDRRCTAGGAAPPRHRTLAGTGAGAAGGAGTGSTGCTRRRLLAVLRRRRLAVVVPAALADGAARAAARARPGAVGDDAWPAAARRLVLWPGVAGRAAGQSGRSAMGEL